MATAPVKPEWLRATVSDQSVGVDREAGIIYGKVVAQQGPFKDERGEFDLQALRAIVKLGREHSNGLKSRFGHPTLSDDGLGKFLGRTQKLRMDTATTPQGEEVAAVRGDLHLSRTAFDEPPGGGKPLAEYVMDLAEEDSEALSSSLVLEIEEELRLDKKGRRLVDEDTGRELPPLWRPVRLHASDIVDTGDAVDGLLGAQLSADDLPDAVVRQGCQLLSRQFAGKSREFVEARVHAWLERYLSWRFDDEPDDSTSKPASEVEIAAAELELAKHT